jgi:hypothetical protein
VVSTNSATPANAYATAAYCVVSTTTTAAASATAAAA